MMQWRNFIDWILGPRERKENASGYVQDDRWFCSQCYGPALFAANAEKPTLAVRFIGYEHKLDCPTLEWKPDSGGNDAVVAQKKDD